MACSSSSNSSGSVVLRKVARLKLQLEDRVETVKVLKILKKLTDLDVTVDVLAETGIGKTVNSLRRHEQAGELAKSLVRGWKKLLSERNLSLTDHVSEVLCVKEKEKGGNKDINNNCKSPDSLDETVCKAQSRKQRGGEESGKKKGRQNHFQSCALENEIESDERDYSFSPKKHKDRAGRWREGNNNKREEMSPRSRSREKLRIISDRRRLEKESDKKLSKERGGKEYFSFHSTDKLSKALKPSKHGDDESSGFSQSSVGRKRKKTGREKKSSESDDSKHKNKRVKEEGGGEGGRDGGKEKEEKALLSFESYLNYDVNVSKRKERVGAKTPSKTVRRETKSHPIVKPFKPPVSVYPAQQKPEELTHVPAAATQPEWDKPLCVDRKERDPCSVSEELGVFTGQRLNRKMQVYSGAKTVFLPNMLSLHQQCVRTLQNNINMLHDTGRVPFEILEPVLERCTPEQLLHIEECNPVYIGVSDHLWGKHCQRDFKDSKLQEYESWKEMYIRLSEERERKLQRLTKSIVSAHSGKPKGRQVKMAFIHTVAKPPRDVRIQQEIHGTAVQQPQQPRNSVKTEDNKSRPNTNEPSKSSSSSSVVTHSTQDQRKKPKVAPMMAKSLKAFKKQLGRR